MNILVTGGAGYIGSTLVPELLQLDHDVTVLDNFMYRENSLASVMHAEHLSVVQGDIRDRALMKDLLSDRDLVIPLAAIVGAPACQRDPVGATSINRDAVIMMLDLLRPNQYVIMPTTNSAYGHGEEGGYCDESSPLHPLSQYAREKVEIEERLMAHEMATSLRLATVFGMSPRMRLDLLVNDFVYRSVQDGFIVLFESHFKRNYIHVRDVARAFILAIEAQDRFKGEIFNVGLSSANLSKLELCEAIKRHVPDLLIVEADLRQDPDQRNYLVSNEKIESAGFTPEFDLDRGIRELLKGVPMLVDQRHRNF